MGCKQSSPSRRCVLMAILKILIAVYGICCFLGTAYVLSVLVPSFMLRVYFFMLAFVILWSGAFLRRVQSTH